MALNAFSGLEVYSVTANDRNQVKGQMSKANPVEKKRKSRNLLTITRFTNKVQQALSASFLLKAMSSTVSRTTKLIDIEKASW
jgi:hypothetical protein